MDARTARRPPARTTAVAASRKAAGAGASASSAQANGRISSVPAVTPSTTIGMDTAVPEAFVAGCGR